MFGKIKEFFSWLFDLKPTEGEETVTCSRKKLQDFFDKYDAVIEENKELKERNSLLEKALNKKILDQDVGAGSLASKLSRDVEKLQQALDKKTKEKDVIEELLLSEIEKNLLEIKKLKDEINILKLISSVKKDEGRRTERNSSPIERVSIDPLEDNYPLEDQRSENKNDSIDYTVNTLAELKKRIIDLRV